MTRPLCSVICASFQRAHLLERSLTAYELQDFDNERLELIVIDDHSDDQTREMVLDWSATTKIAATVLTTAPKPEAWRDCGAILNAGIRVSSGQFVLLTHPEVIPGWRSVAACVEKLKEFESDWHHKSANAVRDRSTPGSYRLPNSEILPIGMYAACKVYYLRPSDQVQLDSVPWQTEGALAVRKIPGFYDEDDAGALDYKHHVTDKVATPGFRIPHWRSWVFGGCSRATWNRLGGMWVTQRWGSVDIGFCVRRERLGMAEWTCPDDDSIVVHQFHGMPGDVETPRIESEWKKELDSLDQSKLCYPDVDEL